MPEFTRSICASCAYYDPEPVYNDEGKMRPVKGACRRHSPDRRSSDGIGIWPHAEPDDWCGEYERRPKSQ